MSRSVPAAILTALTQDNVQPFYAVEALFASGAVRFWTGYGNRGIGPAINADQINIGESYVIKSVGTTDFTLIGAEANEVGQSFIATDNGDGNGTVQASYIGTGNLLTISGLEEVSDMAAKSASVTLNGIPGALISLALQEPYQNRPCRILFGVRDVDDIVEVFSGTVDKMPIEDGAETGTIVATVESKWVRLGRPNIRRYTSESQKSRYPTDTFFDWVADLQDKETLWGRSSA